MTTTMTCGKCGEKINGVDKYAPATVYHLECLMKATEVVRGKIMAIHGIKETK